MNPDDDLDALIEDLLQGRAPDPAQRSPATRRVARLARMLAAVGASEPADDAPAALAGSVLGVYRLQRVIGSGGMGEVWLAARCDGQVEQQVAIKRVRDGRPGLAQRMLRERRALARLAHPHIARFLDAGVDASGAPYLVMEYVDGMPIDQWCAAHAASVEQRIDLLIAIGEALAHAHRMLVVHRDLKPANVLVDAAGQPRLLDFGIARLLEDSGEHSETGGAAMTLAWAAPEQLLGDEFSTATDVHALALLAFHLLSGGLPALREQPSTARLALRIGHEDAERASVAAARRGKRAPVAVECLRGDLDAIVARGLRIDPAARYAGVEALVDDLRRHRAGLPVAARDGQRGYRVRRLAWRYRVWLAAGAIAVGGLLGGSLLAWQQASRALAASRASLAVQHLLEDVFISADPWRTPIPGRVPDALDLARRGLARIDADLADQPRVQAELYLRLGRVFTVAGSRSDAQRAYGRAADLLESLPDATLRERASARLLHAGTIFYGGDFDAAERSVLALLAKHSVASLDAVGQGFHVHSLLMDLARERGDYAEALRQHALMLARVDSTEDPPRLRAAISYHKVQIEVRSGDFAAALADALATLEQHAALPTLTPQWHAHVVERCLQALLALGPADADLARAERNRAQRVRMFGAGSSYDAQSQLTLAQGYLDAGRNDLAAAAAAQAAAHFGGDADGNRSPREWAQARYLQGLAALAVGDLASAQQAAADAHGVFAGYGGAAAAPTLAAAALAAMASGEDASRRASLLQAILAQQQARADLTAPLSAAWLAALAADAETRARHAALGIALLQQQGRPAHRLAAALTALASATPGSDDNSAALTQSTDLLRERIDLAMARVDSQLERAAPVAAQE